MVGIQSGEGVGQKGLDPEGLCCKGGKRFYTLGDTQNIYFLAGHPNVSFGWPWRSHGQDSCYRGWTRP